MSLRTLKQALAEATRRWGKTARVERTKCAHFKPHSDGKVLCSGVGSHAQPCPAGQPLFKVGRIVMIFFEVKGCGRTWEEAFARAALSDHQWLCAKRLHKEQCPVCDGLRGTVEMLT